MTLFSANDVNARRDTKCPTCGKRFAHFVCNDPDRCQRCGEMISRVTLGSIKCKCMAPRMPRGLMNNDSDDRPTTQVRYGN
jgi:phage FluMu protein Com